MPRSRGNHEGYSNGYWTLHVGRFHGMSIGPKEICRQSTWGGLVTYNEGTWPNQTGETGRVPRTATTTPTVTGRTSTQSANARTAGLRAVVLGVGRDRVRSTRVTVFISVVLAGGLLTGCSGSGSADCDSWLSQYTAAMQAAQDVINSHVGSYEKYQNGEISFEMYSQMGDDEKSAKLRIQGVLNSARDAGCFDVIYENALKLSRPLW